MWLAAANEERDSMRSEIITALISAAATLAAAYIGKADFSDHRDALAQSNS